MDEIFKITPEYQIEQLQPPFENLSTFRSDKGEVSITDKYRLSNGDLVQFVEAVPTSRTVLNDNQPNINGAHIVINKLTNYDKFITAIITDDEGHRIAHFGGGLLDNTLHAEGLSIPLDIDDLLPDDLRMVASDIRGAGNEQFAMAVASNYRGKHKASEVIYLLIYYAGLKGIATVEIGLDASISTAGFSVYQATGAEIGENGHLQYDVNKVINEKAVYIESLLKQ